MRIQGILTSTLLSLGVLQHAQGVPPKNNYASHFAQEEHVTRAAFDIGSGETKITVGEVNATTNKINRIWLQTFKVVELRRDFQE